MSTGCWKYSSWFFDVFPRRVVYMAKDWCTHIHGFVRTWTKIGKNMSWDCWPFVHGLFGICTRLKDIFRRNSANMSIIWLAYVQCLMIIRIGGHMSTVLWTDFYKRFGFKQLYRRLRKHTHGFLGIFPRNIGRMSRVWKKYVHGLVDIFPQIAENLYS